MKLQNAKSILFMLITVISGCFLTSCHDLNPRWTNSYFHREDNVKRICNTLAGNYNIKPMRIVRTDQSGATVIFKDSALQAMLPDPSLQPQYFVGGYGDQQITIPNVPINLAAPCLNDTALAHAVSSMPAQNLVIRYDLSEETGAEKESDGVIRFYPQPLSLTLNVDGKPHVVEFDFKSNYALLIDGEEPASLVIPSLQIDLVEVKVIGGNKQDIGDAWSNSPQFFIACYGEQTKQ